MKRLLLIIVAVAGFAISADAQFFNNEGKLYVMNDMFYIDGIPLKDGEILNLLGEDVYNEEYLPARNKLRTADVMGYIGATLVGTGVGCAAGQLVATAAYGGEFAARPYIVYGCIAAVGIIPSVLHFTMYKNGSATYARIAENYNKNTGKVMELTLSPAKSGFGIAINF